MDTTLHQVNSDARGFVARWTPLLAVVGLVCLYFLALRPASTLAEWSTDYETALSRAATDQRRVLLAFHMDGCAPCSAMDRIVLGSGAVREQLGAFIPIRVDTAIHHDLANEFRVLGTPTYAIVDSRGHVVSRCEGYQPVKTFVSFLQRARPTATFASEATPQDGR